MQRLAMVLSAACCFVVSAGVEAPATAQSDPVIRWSEGQEVVVDRFDCKERNADTLIVTGKVTVRHPSDTSVDGPPPIVKIMCPKLTFEPGAEIVTPSSLDIRISEEAGGPIQLRSTRGVAGADAAPTPAIWVRSTAAPGLGGGNGGDGRSAQTDFKGDWSADRGGSGANGTRGYDGKDGVKGADGRAGTSASHFKLSVATYREGATIRITAIGGAGGTAGKGGTGQNGGDGGNGGVGGRGGNGNTLHPGASGGNGGNGGDGGNGGNGGRGGNGGDAGNGGNIFVYIGAGGRLPADATYIQHGGRGGEPGEGGDPGIGGAGGPGGRAGCGGEGGSYKFIVDFGGKANADGSCGSDGVRGRKGVDGIKGPPGVWGRDGRPGNLGDFHIGYVQPKDL